MLRTIQLHSLSLLIGIAFALLGVVAMGQAPAAKRPAAAHDSGLLQVAHPRDWVVIEEGVPYTVPFGKLLVITALGSSNSAGVTSTMISQLSINGQPAVEAPIYIAGGQDTASMRTIPVGLRAVAGEAVDVFGGYSAVSDCRAWGYLVDA